jgi:hypothetical protein
MSTKVFFYFELIGSTELKFMQLIPVELKSINISQIMQKAYFQIHFDNNISVVTSDENIV